MRDLRYLSSNELLILHRKAGSAELVGRANNAKCRKGEWGVMKSCLVLLRQRRYVPQPTGCRLQTATLGLLCA